MAKSQLFVALDRPGEKCQWHDAPELFWLLNKTYGNGVCVYDCGCITVLTKVELKEDEENALAKG